MATFHLFAVSILTIVVFVAFVRDWLPPDLIALGVLAVVLILGMVSGDDLTGIFSNSAPITIAAMFVISAALVRTGVLDRLGILFENAASGSELRVFLLLAITVLPLSACVNNTPVVIVLLPTILGLTRNSHLKASRLLIPLSFFSILGGTMTLIGTSTNILVSGMVSQHGYRPFGIFEITKLGVLCAAAGTVYLLTIGRHLLPIRETISSLLSIEETRSFLTQIVVEKDSPFAGKTLLETPIGKNRTLRVFEVIRDGERITTQSLDELPLQPGDLLVLNVRPSDVATIEETAGIHVRQFPENDAAMPRGSSAVLVEAIIGPRSRFIGRSLRELGLRRRFGVIVAAIHRRGVNITERFGDIRFRFGDVLLIQGPAENIRTLREADDFLSLNERRHYPFRRHKAPIAIAAVLAVIVLAALNVMPIVSLAVIGAIGVVVLRCIDPQEAYEAIDWKILFIIFGMLGLGKAMENTGAAKLVAESAMQWLAPFGPIAVLAAIYVITSALTECVTNNAVAILMTPIAISIAESMQVDPRAFIVAIMFGASASFATPIGYQTNTYVFGAGGYRFSDFAKVGVPLNILLGIIAIVFIPLFWPLTPAGTE